MHYSCVFICKRVPGSVCLGLFRERRGVRPRVVSPGSLHCLPVSASVTEKR